MNQVEIMNMVYILLLVFVGYQVKKIYTTKKQATTNRRVFKPKNRILMIIPAILLVFMGGLYLFQPAQPSMSQIPPLVMGVVFIAIAVGLLYIAMDEIILADEGIYGFSRFIPWTDMKQWGFTKDKKYLIIATTMPGLKKDVNIAVQPKDAPEINAIIGAYKKKKKNSAKKK